MGTTMSDSDTRGDRGAILAGLHLRDDDLEPQPGLRFASTVFRICSIVILVLALWQFADWWMDRPPGDVGLSILVSDTIRLIVLAALLWAASTLAGLFVKSHYDLRATRILLTRLSHTVREMAAAQGHLPSRPAGAQRDEDPDVSRQSSRDAGP
jgi:hypothetical protein